MKGEQYDLQTVVSAEFDPAGQFLAFIRGNRLSIWQLNRGAKLHLEANVPDPVTLHFDQTGQLLFIGASEKITIWDMESKTIIAEYDVLGLTSFTISEDNRLLSWGDDTGVVHLWGVAK